MSINSILGSYVSQYNSKQRVTGLYSGFDTDTAVKSMMAYSQARLGLYQQTMLKLTWKKEGYQSFNNTLRTFKDDFTTVTKQSQNMLSKLNYVANKVNVTGGNGEATVTVDGNAQEGSYSVKVLQLAKKPMYETSAWTTVNGESVRVPTRVTGTGGYGLDRNMTLEEVGQAVERAGYRPGSATLNFLYEDWQEQDDGTKILKGKTLEVTINKQKFIFNGSQTLGEMMETINKSGAGVTMSYSQLTDRFTIESTTGKPFEIESTKGNFVAGFGLEKVEMSGLESGDRVTAGAGGNGLSRSMKLSEVNDALASLHPTDTLLSGSNTLEFTINGKSFAFNENHTLGEVIDTVNRSGANVKMIYDAATDRMSIESTNGQKVQLTSDIGGFAENFRLQGAASQSTMVEINGQSYMSDSNTFTVDGMTVKVNRVTEADKPVTFNVTRDVDQAVDMIKKYVEELNKVITSVNKMYAEKPDRKYPPLTDAQRAELTEDEVKAWDEKSKQGAFYMDASLMTLKTQIRSAFYTPVDGGKSLFSIGLSTRSLIDPTISSTEMRNEVDGTIVIDEDKLRAALAEDPDMVFRMFANDAVTTTASGAEIVDTAKSGLVTRINGAIKSYIESTEAKIDFTDMSLTRSQNSINDLIERMKAEEERYYAKFTAMETALSNLSAQTSYLASMLGTSSS